MTDQQTCRYPKCRCGLWCERGNRWRDDIAADVAEAKRDRFEQSRGKGASATEKT